MKFVAHRGFSAKYQENTIPAFNAVLKHPECGKLITGIETDIRLTGDGKMAVYHDDKVHLKGEHMPVDKISYAELQEALKVRFQGVKVPVLDEFFDCIGHKLELLVEMKDGGYDKKAFMDSLDASLRRYAPKGDVILHSFSAELMELAVKRFRNHGVRFGVLTWGGAKALRQFSVEVMEAVETIHPYWEDLAKDEDSFASYGKPLNVWTVNKDYELEAMKKLRNASIVRAVMTDDLRLLECYR
jgi:glycerophosphoryl diester phosphodiesterase